MTLEVKRMIFGDELQSIGHHPYLDSVIQEHTVHCFSYCFHSTE